MPEEAVAEAEAEQAQPSIAEAPAASPEAAPPAEGAAAGESDQPDAEGTEPLAEFVKGLTPDAWDALLKSAPEDVLESSAVIKERERRGEQRARTRQQEEQAAQNSRTEAYRELIDNGNDAEASLRETMEALGPEFRRLERALDPDYADADTAQKAAKLIREALPADGVQAVVTAIKAGAQAEAGQRAVQDTLTSVRKHAELVGTFTDEETQRLDKAKYHDLRTGTNTTSGLLIDILVDRARAQGKEEGVVAGRKERQAEKELVAQIAKVQAVKNGTAPATPAGVAGGVMSLAAFNALPESEQDKVPVAERARIYQQAYAPGKRP